MKRHHPRPFLLERYFARHEFRVFHHLSASDCETLTVRQLLALAGNPPGALLDLSLGYTESQGDPALRHTIAGLYDTISPDDVLVTAAPEEAIALVMHTLVNPGSRLVVQSPCYQSLSELARARGCVVEPWQVVETDSGWELDLAGLARLLKRPADLVVVNLPHNPTGVHAGAREQAEILRLTRRAGARLFSDEMYRGLEWGERPRLPAACDLDPAALSLGGLSKAYGLPGLRLGWLAGRDARALRALGAARDYTTICNSAPSELLARSAVSIEATLSARSRHRISANVPSVEAFMATHGDRFAWRRPQAGPVALVRLRQGSAAGFCRQARDAGILMVPSRLFAHGDAHVRLGLGRAGVEEGLAALGRMLEAEAV